MLLLIARENQNVVEIYCHIYVKYAVEHPIHQALECTWRITQPKGKNSKLKQPKPRGECGFKLVPLRDGYLVIALAQINF